MDFLLGLKFQVHFKLRVIPFPNLSRSPPPLPTTTLAEHQDAHLLRQRYAPVSFFYPYYLFFFFFLQRLLLETEKGKRPKRCRQHLLGLGMFFNFISICVTNFLFLQLDYL